jgi:dihydrofolate synthase/folylpolyglutamate synthase
MDYREAIQFLYGLRTFGLKLGLETTQRLAALAGNPHDRLAFIHVAGTNGKGSTCAMLEAIYRAAGLRVGLYTSPHLLSFAERIQVNRNCIAREDVARLVAALRDWIETPGHFESPPSFFEVVTVMALKYFVDQRCDLVIWETGLGGRLDATNIVTPLASVITNVQLDHQQWLGDTIPQIAREKAGIIKPGVPIITGAEGEALEVVRETARLAPAPLHVVTLAEAAALSDGQISLAGQHQKQNAALAARTVQELQPRIPVPERALREGLAETQWAGRWQSVTRDNGQTIILDGAHNPAGAEMLAQVWRSELFGKRAALILGMMRDKDCAALCEILAPLASILFITPLASERSADPETLAEFCRKANRAAPAVVCRDAADALNRSSGERMVIAAGSLYLVGEMLELLGAAPGGDERALNEYGMALGRTLPVRAVTFDAGGTLLQPWPSVGEVYRRIAQRHGIATSAERLDRQFAAAWKERKSFGYARADWSELVKQTFAGVASAEDCERFFPELYEAFADPGAWRVFDDVVPCLERLKASGAKLGVISNWDERLRPLLGKLGLSRYFDEIIISCEAGVAKPDPGIFRLAAQRLQVPSGALLHVGDSRSEDAEGAKGAGCQALLLTRAGDGSEGGGIRSLAEVLAPRRHIRRGQGVSKLT